ncbi:MAG: glycosyltransferase family 4 protein [Synechococcales cyanobacterium RM1_1_8]|nr:glycosyltransferase family 4 protein [Synechococcales cyanobacterium RM1_1_8]
MNGQTLSGQTLNVQPTSAQDSSKALNITILVSDLSDSGAGRWGDAVRPFLLTKALHSLGHRVKILGFNKDGSGSLQSAEQLPIQQIPGGIYPKFFSSARQLLKALADQPGDLIYAYKPKPSSFGLGLLHRWRHRTPLFLDIDDWELSWHGGDAYRYRASPRQLIRDLRSDCALREPDHPAYLKQLERLIGRADRVTTHNQFLQRRFGGTYIPNGKDIHAFDPARYDGQGSRDRFHLTGFRTLMFPGAPRPYKGVEDILAALEQLNWPDLRLVIVGGSPYDQYDQQLMSRWGQWIIKIPKVPYSQMPEVISAADCIVVPQQDVPAAQAQFPLKLTDGMAMAKPILATRVGDIPRIVGDTGELADPGNPAQLAAGIEAIFSDLAAAQARGQRGRDRCIEHYSIEAMARTLAEILPVKR